MAPALSSLIAHERPDTAHILKCLFSKQVDLRILILEYCYLGTNGDDFLRNIVALYPDLEVLSLAVSHPITSGGYCRITRLTKLSELKLSDCEI
jgi:hypothetical protein